MSDEASILAFATKGSASNDENRLRRLLECCADVSFVPFDYTHKFRSFRRVVGEVRRSRPGLLVMEGTGLAGGVACMLARGLFGVPYVVSSGDAVGPFVGARSILLGPAFAVYERLLCRLCAGYIGWSPYLAGRALTFGAPRAMTAAGWSDFAPEAEELSARRRAVREELGIGENEIVFGIVGSLVWTRRAGYCYGQELVRAVMRAERPGIRVLICGGGDGLERLHGLARSRVGREVLLPGAVPHERVIDYLAAMDVASLPQSVDRLGSFRYTTKLSEYVAARLPVVTGQIPLAYDLEAEGGSTAGADASRQASSDDGEHGWMWRLPGDAPWSETYIDALAGLMRTISADQIARYRDAIPVRPELFDRERQVRRTARFISDIQARQAPIPRAPASAIAADRPPALADDRPELTRPATPLVRPAHHAKSQLRLLSIGHSYAVAMNRRLVHEMHRAGAGRWEVTAVAPDYFHGAQDLRPIEFEPLENEPCRVEVVSAKLTRFVHFFGYDPRLRDVLTEGWDLIHAWEEPYIRVGWQIARWAPPGAPLVYRTAQSLNKHYPPPFNWMEEHNMARASGWICSGRLVAQTLGARRMYQRRPMRLIPLGVDVDVFRPDPAARREVRRKLDWDEDGPPVVGYLGRFVRAKGLNLLMRALDGLDTPWRAMFVGAGPGEGELRRWAERHGDRVRVCNDVRHAAVPRYLNAMDVMCAPSQTTPGWREQFGRMLIEAFACGVPVIGSDSGEIPFVIDDAGIVCPERDRAEWTRQLRIVLESPARREDMARKGIARAHEHYAWPVIGRAYVDFFEQILDSRRQLR